MTNEQLMPSEVREHVLAQHREIEQILIELEAGATKLSAGHPEEENIKRAATALRGILDMHMAYEEQHLVPAVRETDGFGPARADHILQEHASQRKILDEMVQSISSADSSEQLVDGVRRLATALRDDIRDEECNYVNAHLLHDDLIPPDTFSG